MRYISERSNDGEPSQIIEIAKQRPIEIFIVREKRKKMQAFQSFLQKNQSPSIIQVSNHSDHEEQVEPVSQCTVCDAQLGDRKKFCGFCREAACSEHLRKKRKPKGSNKFVKICDKCEDKILFDKHMKLQLKHQESITAHENIVMLKKEEIDAQLNGRTTKLQILYNKQNQLLKEKKQNDKRYTAQINQLNLKFDKLAKKQAQLKKTEDQLTSVQKKLPPPLYEDYEALVQENEKIVKDLVKYDRLCNQAIKTKSNKQKQIYQQYHAWENKQRKKQEAKKDDDCSIF